MSPMGDSRPPADTRKHPVGTRSFVFNGHEARNDADAATAADRPDATTSADAQ